MRLPEASCPRKWAQPTGLFKHLFEPTFLPELADTWAQRGRKVMATVSRDLPGKPHLDVPKREARALLKDWRAKKPEALERIASRHPRFRDADHAKVAQGEFLLNDAQLVIASEYGFKNWTTLKERIDGNNVVGLLLEAIHKDDRDSLCGCCAGIRICCMCRCGVGIGGRR